MKTIFSLRTATMLGGLLTLALVAGCSGGGGGYWNHPYGYNNGYNQRGSSWYNGRAHGSEGSEYHNRAVGDNRTYQEFQQQERGRYRRG